MDKQKGKILRIEKTSIHDGDGLRTVIFLKGCPLRCKWCSTPESWSMDCDGVYGYEATVEELVQEVCKDEVFFFHSGGGVTISGGEVLMQIPFVREVLRGCREQGVPTAIESSFLGNYEELKTLFPYLNAIYVDFKLADEQLHKKYTGVSNRNINENITRMCEEFDGEVHIRIPMIPTVNMIEDNMIQTANFINTLKKVNDLELLPYHRLGLDTYQKMGLTYPLPEISTPTVETMREMADILQLNQLTCPIKIKGELLEES